MWRAGSAVGIILASAIFVLVGCSSEGSSPGSSTKGSTTRAEEAHQKIEPWKTPTSVRQQVASVPSPTSKPTAVPTSAPSPVPPTSTPSPATSSAGDLALIRDGNLWLSNVRLGTQIPLTADGGNSSPAWCPDGSCLVFVHSTGATTELHRVGADGSARRRLLGGDGIYLDPRWSPRGDVILFALKRDTNRDGKIDERDVAEVWLVNADGSGSRKVVEGMDATWAPEGLRIAFATLGRLEADVPYRRINTINVVNREGKNEWTLASTQRMPAEVAVGGSKFSPGVFLLRYPSWSPASKGIAFTAMGHTGMVLSISEKAADLRTWAANYEGGFGRVIWSPVGERLSFESRPASGINSVGIASAPDLNPTAIGGARTGRSAISPAWSPDGRFVAFVQETGSRFIGTVNANGEDLKQVASGNVSEPQWNPRSR